MSWSFFYIFNSRIILQKKCVVSDNSHVFIVEKEFPMTTRLKRLSCSPSELKVLSSISGVNVFFFLFFGVKKFFVLLLLFFVVFILLFDRLSASVANWAVLALPIVLVKSLLKSL